MEFTLFFNSVLALMRDGLWAPVAVLIIASLVWLVIKNYRADALKREQMLMDFVDQNKAEAAKREDRLMTHLAKTEESNAKIAATLERIEIRMQYVEAAVKAERKAE